MEKEVKKSIILFTLFFTYVIISLSFLTFYFSQPGSDGTFVFEVTKETKTEVSLYLPLNYSEIIQIDFDTVCNNFTSLNYSSCSGYQSSSQFSLRCNNSWVAIHVGISKSSIGGSNTTLSATFPYGEEYSYNEHTPSEGDKQIIISSVNKFVLILGITIDWDEAGWGVG